MNKIKLFRRDIDADEPTSWKDSTQDLEKRINDWLDKHNEKINIHKMFLTAEPQTFFIWYETTDIKKKRLTSTFKGNNV
jgi:hypothetical protein